MESAGFVRGSQDPLEDAEESSGDYKGNSNEQRLPEIEARLALNENILLKIRCENRKGLLVKILEELDNLNLTVVNASVTSFGDAILDITIVVEMEKESSLEVNDIVAALRSTLQAST